MHHFLFIQPESNRIIGFPKIPIPKGKLGFVVLNLEFSHVERQFFLSVFLSLTLRSLLSLSLRQSAEHI